MYYSNKHSHHVMLGDYVKTGRQINAHVCIVKKIDEDNDMVYIVPVDGSYIGGWVSGNALFYVWELDHAKQ
jgi:hypothetical protein